MCRWIERALFVILPVCDASVDCIASSRCGSGVVQAAVGGERGCSRCMGCTTNRCCRLESRLYTLLQIIPEMGDRARRGSEVRRSSVNMVKIEVSHELT
jgi:hypothetical protein